MRMHSRLRRLPSGRKRATVAVHGDGFRAVPGPLAGRKRQAGRRMALRDVARVTGRTVPAEAEASALRTSRSTAAAS